MRLNPEALLILDALDRHGSFAAAAAALFKTPSALSYMVQKLENDLDITLLDRSGHRAKFTDTGKLMLEKAGCCCGRRRIWSSRRATWRTAGKARSRSGSTPPSRSPACCH